MKYLDRGADKILLATDFTENAQRAFDAAIRLAQTFGAKLYILHANEEEAVFDGHGSDELVHFFTDIMTRRTEWMDGFVTVAEELGVEASGITREGIASDTIRAVATELDVGVIVMGTTGVRGLSKILHGSTATKVLRQAERPVLVVSPNVALEPPAPASKFSHVLYPIDFSPASRAGLSIAQLIAERAGARLSIAHVLRIPTALGALPGEMPIMIPHDAAHHLEISVSERLREIADSISTLEVETHIEVHSDTAEAIAELVAREGVDMIVIPRHSSHSVGSFLFGHTAENLSKIAPAPVLLFNPR